MSSLDAILQQLTRSTLTSSARLGGPARGWITAQALLRSAARYCGASLAS
jgi:hypothetical protein